jgi:hypothetical protein
MKISKRVAWLSLAGVCCLGLWLSTGASMTTAKANNGAETGRGGENNAGLVGYCPVGLYYYYNGLYYYAVKGSANECAPLGCLTTTSPVKIDCPNCSELIYTTTVPMALPDDLSDLKPKPDPLFSGVIR